MTTHTVNKQADVPIAATLPALSDEGINPIHQAVRLDQNGVETTVSIIGERPLTIKVDGKEVVTLMTAGTHPERLTLGYLRNQLLFESITEIASIEVDWNREVADVSTHHGNGIAALDQSQRIVTTGCGQGTMLSCTMDKMYHYRLRKTQVKQSEIYAVLSAVQQHNRLYRETGSLHSCGLCRDGKVRYFVEDVGRHNAMDSIAGEMWLRHIEGTGHSFYTTGRLTSEIVIKAAFMGIPTLISRNGATQMGVELAEELGVMLISRAKSRQFTALNAKNRLVFDAIPGSNL